MTGATQSFYWGTSSNPSNTATISSNSVSLTGLTAGMVYYYDIFASNSGTGCKVSGTSASGAFWTSSSGGGTCPKGTLSLSGVSASLNSAGTAATVYFSVSPATTTPLAWSATVSWGTSSNNLANTIGNAVSGSSQMTGLTAGTTYYYQVSVAAGCYTGASTSVLSFTSACTISGTVDLAMPSGWNSAPLYGIDVTITQTFGGSTVLSAPLTGTTGAYSIGQSLCSRGTYSIGVQGLGYQPDPSNAASVSLGFGSFPTVNLQMDPMSTSLSGTSVVDIYSVTSGYTTISFISNNPTSTNVANVNGGTVSYSSVTGMSAPPSGQTKVVYLTGSDKSSSSSPGAWAWEPLSPWNNPLPNQGHAALPLGGSLSLSYFIWVPTSSVSNHFGIDSDLSNGVSFGTQNDAFGGPVKDGNGQTCYASHENPTEGQWVHVVCDLSTEWQTSLGDMFMEYDTGGGTTSGTFTAYFDDVQLIETTYPRAITNGGFEQRCACGWVYSGVPLYALTGSYTYGSTTLTPPTNGGGQFLVMGGFAGTGLLSMFSGTAVASQEFRIPNSDTLNYELDFYAAIGYSSSCANSPCPASGDRQFFEIYDASAHQMLVPDSGLGSFGWTLFQQSLAGLNGHLLWIYFGVDDVSGGSAPYFALDEVQLEATSASSPQLVESAPTGSGFNFPVSLSLPSSIYRPVISQPCSTATVHDLPYSLDAYREQATTNTFTDYDNLTLALDLQSFTNDRCSGTNTDQLAFSITGGLNTSGFSPGYLTSSLGWVFYMEDACLVMVVSGGSSTNPVGAGQQASAPGPFSWGLLSGNLWTPHPGDQFSLGALGLALDSMGIGFDILAAASIAGGPVLPIVLTIAALAVEVYAMFNSGASGTTTCQSISSGSTTSSATQVWDWYAPGAGTYAYTNALVFADPLAGIGSPTSSGGTYTITVTLYLDVGMSDFFCGPLGCTGNGGVHDHTSSVQLTLSVTDT